MGPLRINGSMHLEIYQNECDENIVVYIREF